jgi:hypothetical protein
VLRKWIIWWLEEVLVVAVLVQALELQEVVVQVVLEQAHR